MDNDDSHEPSEPVPCLQNLPYEILITICSHLCGYCHGGSRENSHKESDIRWTALTNLMQTARRLRLAALPCHAHRPVVRPKHMNQFVRHLAANPDKAEMVKKFDYLHSSMFVLPRGDISVIGSQGRARVGQYFQEINRRYPTLSVMLVVMPNLEQLRIFGRYIWARISSILGEYLEHNFYRNALPPVLNNLQALTMDSVHSCHGSFSRSDRHVGYVMQRICHFVAIAAPKLHTLRLGNLMAALHRPMSDPVLFLDFSRPYERPKNLRVLEFYRCAFGVVEIPRSLISQLVASNKMLEEFSFSLNCCDCTSERIQAIGATYMGARHVIDLLQKHRLQHLRILNLNCLDIPGPEPFRSYDVCLQGRRHYRPWAAGITNSKVWNEYEYTSEHFTSLKELSIDEQSFSLHWKVRHPAGSSWSHGPPPLLPSEFEYQPELWSNIATPALKQFTLILKGGPLAVPAIYLLRNHITNGRLPCLERAVFIITPIEVESTDCFNEALYQNELNSIRQLAKVTTANVVVKAWDGSTWIIVDLSKNAPTDIETDSEGSQEA